MSVDDILGRDCPVCGYAYMEHSFVELAECMEATVEWHPSLVISVVPRRRVETVAGPTLARVL